MNIFGYKIFERTQVAKSASVETVAGIIGTSSAESDFLRKIMDDESPEWKQYFIDCSTTKGRNDAYKKCDVVRSVLGKSSGFIANLKVWALDEDGKQVKTPQAQKIIAKLNRPNPYEDFKRWFRKLDAQCKLHGHAYVHKKYSSLFKEYDYYVIPFEYVTEEWDNTTNLLYDRQVKRYLINDNVKSYYLKPEDVHVFYDVSLDMETYGYRMLGGSRLQSLSEVISTYVVLWETLTEMYGDSGARNLISLGANSPQMMAMPKLKDEKENIYKLLKKFGNRRKQDKNAVTSADAKVFQLTAKMSEMEYANTIKDCKKSIANAYEIPPELLGIESSRFKTVPEARKEAYTQSAIPSAEYYFSEWLQMVGETSLPFSIKADYSHLDFYQEAKLQEAVAYQQMAGAVVPLVSNNIITVAEARVKLDLE
jgi:hypothetical protein